MKDLNSNNNFRIESEKTFDLFDFNNDISPIQSPIQFLLNSPNNGLDILNENNVTLSN